MSEIDRAGRKIGGEEAVRLRRLSDAADPIRESNCGLAPPDSQMVGQGQDYLRLLRRYRKKGEAGPLAYQGPG